MAGKKTTTITNILRMNAIDEVGKLLTTLTLSQIFTRYGVIPDTVPLFKET